MEEVPGKVFLREGGRVDSDSLPDRDEVGRDEQTNLPGDAVCRLVLGEDGVCEGAGAAFAFGSGDVDDVEPVKVSALRWWLALAT